MAKKPINVTIRKASSAPPSEVSPSPPGFRAVTLYLPDALFELMIKHYRDRDLSAVVGDILQKHLMGLEQPVVSAEDPVSRDMERLVKWVQGKFSRVVSLRPAWLF